MTLRAKGKTPNVTNLESSTVRYSIFCPLYSDCLDSAVLVWQNLLKQGVVASMLIPSLQKVYGHHDDWLIVTKYPFLKFNGNACFPGLE